MAPARAPKLQLAVQQANFAAKRVKKRRNKSPYLPFGIAEGLLKQVEVLVVLVVVLQLSGPSDTASPVAVSGSGLRVDRPRLAPKLFAHRIDPSALVAVVGMLVRCPLAQIFPADWRCLHRNLRIAAVIIGKAVRLPAILAALFNFVNPETLSVI